MLKRMMMTTVMIIHVLVISNDTIWMMIVTIPMVYFVRMLVMAFLLTSSLFMSMCLNLE